MEDRFDRYLVASQILNLMNRLSYRSRLAIPLFDWICDDGEVLDFCIPEDDEDAADHPRHRRHKSMAWLKDRTRGGRLTRDALSELLEIVTEAARRQRTTRRSCIQRNIETLAGQVGLDHIETGILGIALRYHAYFEVESLYDKLFSAREFNIFRLLGATLDAKTADVSRRLAKGSRLILSGLITMNPQYQRSDFGDMLTIAEPVLRAVQPPNRNAADIRRSLFGAPCNTDLHWEDFDHIREDRDLLADLLAEAVLQKAKGVNILLYGPPGTGKTEFCKTVAKKLKLALHAIGEEGEDGSELSRRERLANLRLSNHMLSNQDRTILLFDEMEDVLDRHFEVIAGRPNVGSKVFVNRLLERNALPVFWTCNNIKIFDPAILRRMTLAIELKIPPPAVRERVWHRVLDKHELKLPDATVSGLAREFDAPPSLATSAVRAVKFAGGGEDRIRIAVRGVARAINGGRPTRPVITATGDYEPALMNADQDMEVLTRGTTSNPSLRDFSLCLFGPPGTGKSAFVRQLAGLMGIEVIQKRTSDLMSMYVGETDRNIAAAFDEARERDAFLIFDEADSLLRDRRGAHQSWEVSFVNEMLTWMEVQPQPFACTTNLMESLDAASLRRFTFKVRFDFLSLCQANLAFKHFFGIEVPNSYPLPDVLTPGDFAVVRRKAAIIGNLSDPHALIAMLEGECAAKPEQSRPIGFTASI
jgi:transitional endoplasmic reticulum ATPase